MGHKIRLQFPESLCESNSATVSVTQKKQFNRYLTSFFETLNLATFNYLPKGISTTGKLKNGPKRLHLHVLC